MMKIAVVGASGPTGIHLVTELRKTVATVRVIARSMDKLVQLFPDAAVEKWEADIRDAGATLLAVEGCDIVYDCIGLPGDQMHLHPVTARNIAGALRHTKGRCVQVSSYWAYYPQVRTEMNESQPRRGGPPWIRYRREAEDVLCEAGAAILHLPDFYGPHVQISALQNALNEAASGKTVNWLGRPDVQREYRLRYGTYQTANCTIRYCFTTLMSSVAVMPRHWVRGATDFSQSACPLYPRKQNIGHVFRNVHLNSVVR
jgi:nucleoside-diphosphate-sugar epimerase